ncbi:protein of unknown function [Taphrina deformans PYCC 5710]|uniref:AAA+ ATPase domain-containing protein n=1 Tax=Taphrina deformans (strain PYCC 5710 / ATCC 11124 / CBS 356.35 / IMI 108563 / JCM 9778 / NBRC 8474) TaxID=1097556 RepID=R4XGC8_TAPDE|nr:protein of unknown function [Taphrina deformans PYCC 5710]|eukprot:CCG84687.1 protein of unknown function [Taphrina deformans PYCC 5710]
MSLEDELRRKVEVHVRQYVDKDVQGSKSGPISRIKLYSYIQDNDRFLARKKKVQVEKMIDAVCRDLEAQKLESEEPQAPIEIDDDEGAVDERIINRNITEGWNLATADTRTATMDSTSKRKERPAAKESRAKRPKVDENREPPKNLSLADLGGVEACIAEVLEMIVMPLTHPEVYIHTGVPPPRGVLLHGPPGCGKTLLANAVAGEIGVPFISISAPSLVSGMSGESEKKVREIFEEAKQLAPCLMFIDEIDAVTPKRENAQREMERRIVAQLLTCMDDLSLEKTDGKPVLIIGATNRPDSLDAALRRAGRFDREICMGVPDEKSREQILSVLCRKLNLSGDMDLKILAKMTPGFVGADLNALTAAAGVVAIKRIFQSLQEQARIVATDEDRANTTIDMMELDNAVSEVTSVVETPARVLSDIATTSRLSAIRDFLSAHPEKLTSEDLSLLSITYDDFLIALPKIQPSSKREGFTTVPDVTWTDIGALRSIRAELQMAIVQPIKRPEIYRSVGIVAPAGVLLWGPPGCGKTLLAKAVANESRANFISVRGPELLNKYVGESERAVRQVFMLSFHAVTTPWYLPSLSPQDRANVVQSESSARVVNTLLTELDGLGDRNGVFVIAATNRPDMIDPAMMRPGRLDKPLFVQLPSEQEREEILKTLTKKNPVQQDIDFGVIARDERCGNFSGADLAALVREAAVAALRAAVFHDILDAEPADTTDSVTEQIVITQKNFDEAFEKVKPSVTESQRSKYEKLLKKLL